MSAFTLSQFYRDTLLRMIDRAKPVFRALMSAMALAGTVPARAAEPDRFVIYYGQSASIDELAPYRRAVLDADHHPPIAPLKARGIELFGYVSIGEADETRTYHAEVAAANVLLGSNANWPGAHYADLRKPAWRAFLLDRIIPAVLAQGFQGLFLDTLDDAAFLENADPVGNRGMIEAGAATIRAIRARYPSVPLMLNRAYEVAALVPNELESILAESMASSYDFKTRRYHLRTGADLNWGMARIAELRALNPRMGFYSLDYWDPADRRSILRLYDQERRAGFIPYVATIDLQKIVAEPGMRASR